MKNEIKNFEAEPFDLTKILNYVKSFRQINSLREKVLVILGATSTGKSSLAIQLAEKFDAEIISADSMAVYKNFDIGTAKPNADELKRVKHYLIDILEPYEKFSVVEFVGRAEKIISDINSRGKIPIVVGGTGLYIQALVEGYKFSDVGASGEIPKSRTSYFSEVGNLKYETLVIGLTLNRDKLYERINERTKKMFDAGLIDEVEKLLRSGVSSDCQAMLGIGYKEVVECLEKNLTVEETISKVSQATRNFAKRQMTWYRRMGYIKWISAEEKI